MQPMCLNAPEIVRCCSRVACRHHGTAWHGICIAEGVRVEARADSVRR